MLLRSLPLVILAFVFSVPAALAAPTLDRGEVHESVRSEQWDEVISMLTASLETNPYYGEDWYLLGLAHSGLNDCQTAIPLFSRAIALGANSNTRGMRNAHVEAARCAADQGDLDGAVEHLAIAQARYKFDDFGSLVDDSRFAALLKHPGYRQLTASRDWSGVDRVEGWSADLDYFIDLMERRHPDPFHTVEEADWYAAIAMLREHIPGLSDLEVVLGFMRIAAMIGDGHTLVYPPFAGPLAFHLTPIWPYVFGDEWRILAAAPEFSRLVGARMVDIEGVPMAEAAERIAAPLPRDNDMTPKWTTALALQFAEISQTIFGAEDACCLTIGVELASGERRNVKLTGGAIDRNPMSAWAPAHWPGLRPDHAVSWLKNFDALHWYEEIDDLNAIYAQINQIRDGDEQSLEEFGHELRQRMTEGTYRHLILDLRHNNGGNGYLNWPFVRELVRTQALDRPDSLFVITGRRTFSAAMLLSSMLESHTDAIFVGEPTGSRPQFYGEDTGFQLPYSGLMGSISSRRFQNRFISDDERPWIAPDIVAELEFDDLREGRDPALLAIRRYLESRQEY